MPDLAPQQPASVAVVFDRDEARPVIVEGLANRETGRPVEANDPVRIASISKMIMAITAFELAAEGKIDLGADISLYLGWQVRSPHHPDVPVSINSLLAHRSGLRDRAGYVIPLGESLQGHLEQPEAWYADAPPGEAPFEYANLGSPVVATVLEAASGERFDRLVDRLVFSPLGIEACFNWIGCSARTRSNAVTLYRSTGELARDDLADTAPEACTFPVAEGADCLIEEYVPGTNASIFSPQGGLRIGMIDLAKIGQALLRSARHLGPDRDLLITLAQSTIIGPSDADFFCGYGLGAQTIEMPGRSCNDTLFGDGIMRIGHAGEAYGLRSGFWIDLARGEGLAYFVTAVPARTAPDEGGFSPEEVDLVRRAMQSQDETEN